MEDSFNVRVGKAFGSLASSSSSKSQSLSSLWSLTDHEIEKREWNRDKESPERPEEEEGLLEKFRWKKTITFRAELEKDLDNLDEDEEDEEEARASSTSSKGGKPEDYNDEEWEIKSSIGRDCTLDYEEEEDQYDKVAVGREKTGDRLYMKDVNDYEIDADSGNVLPTTFRDFSRDPRANHIAAKLRLKEDAEAAKKRLEEDAETAKKIDSLRVSDSDGPAGMDAHVSTFEDGNLKSILKRKDDAESNPKPQKRVRFDSECKNDFNEGSEGAEDVPKEACLTDEEEAMVSNKASTLPQDYPSGIPDYLRNPSKYTRYTFDLSDVDDGSNRQAYMDFLKLIKRSDATEPLADDDPSDLTKPVTFIPKRKTSDVIMGESCSEPKQIREDTEKESMHRRGLPIGIAAGDTNDGVCAMEEDEPQTIIDKRNISQRSGRQYRMKPSSESHD
ncbi:tumor suppressing sub-chromosomal transferable candidate 4 - like 2 [Theobroma cacao]|nr:tumor suppressing sub-chromosomal transferable candidate 4 - like 1 [Theobroma cacao]WRX22559.1 tumor suppressing sub-chromosomal transferable candidate 4 - like 2 [Theobroma cacao]